MSTGIPSPLSMPEADRFQGNNFIKFNSVLLSGAKARGVHGYILGTISRPAPPVPVVPPLLPLPPPAPTPWYSDHPSVQEWEMRDAYTHAMISSNVDNPIGYGIKDTMTAAEAYKALTDVYNIKSNLRLVTAEHDLRDAHYIDGANFDTFVADLRTKWSIVNDQGGNIDDARFRGILLNSLPHTWDPIIAGMDIHKTSADVSNCLCMWDARVNAPPVYASTGGANAQALAASTP